MKDGTMTPERLSQIEVWVAVNSEADLYGELIDGIKAGFRDADAIDEINLLLSAKEWPGASGMEDVCNIVRRVRAEIADAPDWERH